MKRIGNKAYVLMETIIVISVLCVILITLFGGYSNLINNVEKKNLYDNTDYLYRTHYVRDFLENKSSIELVNNKTYCQNDTSLDGPTCYTNSCTTEQCSLFRLLKVEGVYVFDWGEKINHMQGISATTLRYINSLDMKKSQNGTKMIVVMYESDIDSPIKKYEYASLKIRL